MNKRAEHLNWYGDGVSLIERNEDCTIVSFRCSGSGKLYDYKIFSGVNLIFMDFKCIDVLKEPDIFHNILEIRHYREGRIEFTFDNDKVFHLQQDEFCINAMVNMPNTFSFPFEYCSGVSLVINQDLVTQDTLDIFNNFHLDIELLKIDLDLNKQWYICKTPPSMVHIFDELYAAKGVEPIQYFRIKVLELLYEACKLKKKDGVATTYFSKQHIDIVKRVRLKMIDDLSSKNSLETYIKNEPVSIVTFQGIFKQIYGMSPYAYLKKYKMNCAAVKLRETKESISQIAISLGYYNASKFSKAFLSTFGILPKDYRAQGKNI